MKTKRTKYIIWNEPRKAGVLTFNNGLPYGKDVDVKKLVDNTKANPDSVETKYADPANEKKGITVYKKEFDGNISTNDTPTGQHRVFDNHDNPEKSTHYPYADRKK